MDLSIVIPVYNSQQIIAEMARRISAALDAQHNPREYEVILVNDGSMDESWSAIERVCEEYPRFRGISLRMNAGQHNAIMAGLRHAAGKVIVVMDDDLQHAPEDVAKLYDQVRAGSDLCYATFRKPRQAPWKVIGSRFRDWTARKMLGLPRDVQISSFKAVAAEVAREAANYEGPFPYVDGLLLMCTRNVSNVHLDHHPRYKGRGNYGFFRSFALWMKVAMNFSVLPLRMAAGLGFLFAVLGFAFAAYLVYHKLANDTIPVPGWASLVVVMLIVGGVQLLALGAIGEYLGRAYVHLNRKPQYVIKATRGFSANRSAESPKDHPRRSSGPNGL